MKKTTLLSLPMLLRPEALCCLCFSVFFNLQAEHVLAQEKTITISNADIRMVLSYGRAARINTLIVHGQHVIGADDGIYTTLKTAARNFSSMHLLARPELTRTRNTVRLRKIRYGKPGLVIEENWIFRISPQAIKWDIERTSSKSVQAGESSLPHFNFDQINTWDGAYQGYGGLAWFYLFNTKLATYGVHTRSSSFWNSKTGNGLRVQIEAPARQVAMSYTRTAEDRLAYSVSISDLEMQYKLDSGTNRRRFIRGRTDVWSPQHIQAGHSHQSVTLSYFDFKKENDRGVFKGIDGGKVNAVLNTIARIGVIDSLHFGGNSWHTPYGPICLHEQYIAELGLAINDPRYLKGYQSCLDFYRDHAIKPDGRVYPRWAYTNEDAMPGQFNHEGFYEAQWGILMDSNPDYVSNVSELYDMNGDKVWVKTQQLACERALDWLLARDKNGNGLVEAMTDNEAEKKSSDWIDIIWASYENAFVNAKLYHALIKWAAIEQQLNNGVKARFYLSFATHLKTSFNKSVRDGGFWDEDKGCYVHWLDKDKTAHGSNMVTPVNFMAIAYGICDQDIRIKLILDAIEKQMEQEKLFFWPITMKSYAAGEGKEWQFPFPSYENGDLFLSWGSIAVQAYAAYRPDLAVSYVRNVLDQYGKDGLAYQRYGRIKQNGLGDDILSGNSLAIAGLYQSVYGINPRYNRLYLDPHLSPGLAGTVLNYTFRKKRLVIGLDQNQYSIGDGFFEIESEKRFGFYSLGNQLSYFNKNSELSSLQARSRTALTLHILKWDKSNASWAQQLKKAAIHPVLYALHQLQPSSFYKLLINGKPIKQVRTTVRGDLLLAVDGKVRTTSLELKLQNRSLEDRSGDKTGNLEN